MDLKLYLAGCYINSNTTISWTKRTSRMTLGSRLCGRNPKTPTNGFMHARPTSEINSEAQIPFWSPGNGTQINFQTINMAPRSVYTLCYHIWTFVNKASEIAYSNHCFTKETPKTNHSIITSILQASRLVA